MSATHSRTFLDSASTSSTPAGKWRINRMSARTCSRSHNSRTQPLHFHIACQHRTLFRASIPSDDCVILRAECVSYVSQPAPNMLRASKAWRFRFDSGEWIRSVSIWCCMPLRDGQLLASVSKDCSVRVWIPQWAKTLQSLCTSRKSMDEQPGVEVVLCSFCQVPLQSAFAG